MASQTILNNFFFFFTGGGEGWGEMLANFYCMWPFLLQTPKFSQIFVIRHMFAMLARYNMAGRRKQHTLLCQKACFLWTTSPFFPSSTIVFPNYLKTSQWQLSCVFLSSMSKPLPNATREFLLIQPSHPSGHSGVPSVELHGSTHSANQEYNLIRINPCSVKTFIDLCRKIFPICHVCNTYTPTYNKSLCSYFWKLIQFNFLVPLHHVIIYNKKRIWCYKRHFSFLKLKTQS